MVCVAIVFFFNYLKCKNRFQGFPIDSECHILWTRLVNHAVYHSPGENSKSVVNDDRARGGFAPKFKYAWFGSHANRTLPIWRAS